MKQVYKKKPEYLDVVFVADDSQSIKEIYELAGVDNASIKFNENGERVISLDENTNIPVGVVVFKDKKTGKLVVMSQEKLLQFYDLYNDEIVTSDKEEKTMNYKINFWCFIVLCLIGGFIRLQEFYRKKIVLGILAVLFFWTGIPSIVAFIEAVVWLFRGEYEFNKEFGKLNIE